MYLIKKNKNIYKYFKTIYKLFNLQKLIFSKY